MCVGVDMREKTIQQTLVTLCCSTLEGTQVLGCKIVVLNFIDRGPVSFSTPVTILIVEALFQFRLPFLFLALCCVILAYVTGETTFVANRQLTSLQGSR